MGFIVTGNRPNPCPFSSTWPDWVTDIVYLKDRVGGYLFWGWCHPWPTLACTGQFQCLHVLLANASRNSSRRRHWCIKSNYIRFSLSPCYRVTDILWVFYLVFLVLSSRYGMLVAASLVGNFRVFSMNFVRLVDWWCFKVVIRICCLDFLQTWFVSFRQILATWT